MQQLLKAHSSVCDIRDQQKHVISVHQGLESRKSVDYLTTLEKIKENESIGGGEKTTNLRTKVSYSVSPPPHSPEPQKTKADKSDDDVLRRFLGDDNVGKLFSQQNSVSAQDEMDIGKPVLRELGPPVKTLAELKAEAKRDGRSSVAFEMQMLRQKLQEEARRDLAAFDKEFDSPTIPLVLEEDNRKYRHSILNRMDEILNPVPQQYSSNTGHHVRQSSEPVAMWDSTAYNGTHAKSEDVPGLARQSRLNSQQFVSHSFRLPSQQHVDLSRTASESAKHSTHYNTAVVRRRHARPDSSSSIDSNGKHSLQYSVESLNSSEHNLALNGSSNCLADFDLDRPETKMVSPERTMMGSSPKHNKSHSRSRSLQQSELSNYAKKPPVKHAPQLSEELHSGPDIYPETSVALANSKPFTEVKRSFFGRSGTKKAKPDIWM